MKNIILIILCLLPFWLNGQCTEGENLILNGSFESGDFTNWTVQDCAGSFISQNVDLATNPIAPTPSFTIPNAVDGDNIAYNAFDGTGPCEITMCQTVTIPTNVSSALFEWNEIVEWELTFGATLDRTHSVDVIDASTGLVLQNLHNIIAVAGTFNNTANTLGNWSNFTFDLVGYAGQTINLCFTESVPEVMTGPSLIYYDNISLETTCNPPMETIPTLSEWGLIFMAILLMTIGTLNVASATSFAGTNSLKLPSNISNIQLLPYSKSIFISASISTLLLVGIGFSFSLTFTGTIAFSDWVGTIITAPLLTYFLHLLILLELKK